MRCRQLAGLSCSLIWIAIAALGGACTRERIAYRPQASLGLSDESLPLRVELRPLEDRSPADDRVAPAQGSAVTDGEHFAGNLAAAVTQALLECWRADAVFAALDPAPAPGAELVLTGEIRRFYGKSGPNALGWLRWLVYIDPTQTMMSLITFGAPIDRAYGEVSLELRLERPAGERVASYETVIGFTETLSVHGDAAGTLGSRLNRAFSDALAQVRAGLAADRARVLAAARTAPGQP